MTLHTDQKSSKVVATYRSITTAVHAILTEYTQAACHW